MKTTIFTLLLLLSCCQWLVAQCPTGDITFSTQGQVDSFQINYPGCTEIDGNVTITGDGISSLNGINMLIDIGGSLRIENNPQLTSLDGLKNLTSIGFYFYDFSAFDVIDIFGLSIRQNPLLSSLTGLDSLKTIEGSLVIDGNDLLTSLHGLENLVSVKAYCRISDNPELGSLSGLENLDSIGSFIDFDETLHGMHIRGNPKITTMTGLNNLHYIEGGVVIHVNNYLSSLIGLENLNAIGGPLIISDNYLLTSLNGIHNLTKIGVNFYFWIGGCPVLTSLSDLEQLDINGINGLRIQYCTSLSTCDIQPICNYLESGGEATIENNAPGCNSVPEVEEACAASGTFDLSKAGSLLIASPNPAADFLSLLLPEFPGPLNVQVFNMQGKLLSHQSITNSQTMEVGHLPSGIYLLKVTDGEQVFTGKFIKQ